MAFTFISEDHIGSNKQHINLSVYAYEIIQNDMFTFNEEKLSHFINSIFGYYYPKADASISLVLNHFRGELSKLLSSVPGDKDNQKRVLNRLVSKKEEELCKHVNSYEKGISFKFWLNKCNFEYLTDKNSECDEDKYYENKRGKYIKCVLEEYTRLPYIEREKIYFTPFITEIENAIQAENGKRLLKVITEKKAVYSVYPYAILNDPLSTANYLVGYSQRYDNPDDELRPCSFRISALKSIKMLKSKSASLRKEKWEDLSKLIASRGVQFLIDREEEILVRLTSSGIHKYYRQSHLRPTLIEKRNGNVFVFCCTNSQAEFYFFKFGEDAEILFPIELRKKFKSMYQKAANIYQ